MITRRSIVADLREGLGVDQTRAAQVLEIVGSTMTQTASPGQIEDVQGQLPKAMRGILGFSLPEAAEDVNSRASALLRKAI